MRVNAEFAAVERNIDGQGLSMNNVYTLLLVRAIDNRRLAEGPLTRLTATVISRVEQAILEVPDVENQKRPPRSLAGRPWRSHDPYLWRRPSALTM